MRWSFGFDIFRLVYCMLSTYLNNKLVSFLWGLCLFFHLLSTFLYIITVFMEKILAWSLNDFFLLLFYSLGLVFHLALILALWNFDGFWTMWKRLGKQLMMEELCLGLLIHGLYGYVFLSLLSLFLKWISISCKFLCKVLWHMVPTDHTVMSIQATKEIPLKFLTRWTFTVPVSLFFFL